MMRGTHARILIALVLLIVLSGGTAFAQSFGRMLLLFKDADGNPLPDVHVVITCDDITTFKQEKTSNKKGRVTVSVTDATHLYKIHAEHGAYPPFDSEIKLQLGTTTNQEIILKKPEQGQTKAGQASGTVVVYTPAERVFNEGVELLQDGDMAGAKAKFIDALGRDGKMKLAHSALAGVYLEEKDYASALASVEKFRELDPESPRGVRMLYEAHSGLGNKKEADEALKELSKFGGGDTAKMIFNEGVQATKVGDFGTAKKRFLEALEVDASLGEATSALTIIYFNEKEWDKAAAMAESHLSLRPDDQKTMKIRYDAYRLAGNEAKAKESLEILAAVNPEVLIKQFFDAGIRYFEAGDMEKATLEFQRILEISDDHAASHFRLGICHISSGNSEAAKTHLSRFLELAPNDPEAGTAKDMLAYL
jgi:tetratricopeptide (TPR) repeat protein